MVTGARVEVGVDRIAAGGDGIGRLDTGRVVFVPRTAPGDLVVAELTEDRARWARGRVVELLREGGGRVEPPCPHYDVCGGCRLQHLDPETQLRSLERGVADALARIGGREVPVRPLAPAAERYGYRNRVSLTLRRPGGGVVAGYHRLRGPGLADIEDCPLAETAVRRGWHALRLGWGEGASRLPSGRELRITLRGSVTGDLALWIEGGRSPGEPEALLEAVPAIRSYWWRPSGGDRRHLGGEPVFRDIWQGEELELGPEAFLQVNRRVAAEVEEHLDQGLAGDGDGAAGLAGRRMLDLYAGAGTRAVRWARQGARVAAVEREPDAARAAEELARRVGVEVDVRAAAVEEEIGGLLPADDIVVNPPRRGLSAEVCERLARGAAARLAYVSCDPATLARDVRRLGEAWVPRFARPFDAFPQTGHVETVLWLDAREAVA